ncbi:pectate lyase family protein [Halegenticoccus soli]|uniref:glycosyl hydrolase family 28-related protein n=1 Tax=Halegenticoccus soli TaxID=1985678 RepID=UPI000C6EF610|nr:glycosyl hydrolase family 28-related protein [Halegenticoccus soli]
MPGEPERNGARERGGERGDSIETAEERTKRGGQEPRTTPPVGRRAFLGALSATSLGAVAAAGSNTVRGDDGPDVNDESARVVNVVEDYGADPTGSEPVNDAFEEALGPNTTVVFPDGTYLFDRLTRFFEADNTAVVGEGDATITVPDGYADYVISIRGTGVRFENFTVDYAAPNTTAAVAFQSDDDFLMRDVLFEGVRDADGATSCFLVAVTDEDGEGLVENVHCPDGAAEFVPGNGCFVYNAHAGTLRFDRCSMEGMSANALYASGAGQIDRGEMGAVEVENSYFRNNNVSSIRLGTPDSYAKNCTVVVDEEGPTRLYEDSPGNARAIWCYYNMDGFVEDCDVVIDHPAGSGIHYKSGYGAPSRCDVYDSRIEINADGVNAVRTKGEGEPLEYENVSVTGEGGEREVVRLQHREATFEDCCISQTGENRDGFFLLDSTVELEDSTLNVTGEDFVLADSESDYSTDDVDSTGCCTPARAETPWE